MIYLRGTEKSPIKIIVRLMKIFKISAINVEKTITIGGSEWEKINIDCSLIRSE